MSVERRHRRRVTEDDVRRLREFNRFYTKRIGALSPRFLDSAFSLTEVRILFELAHGTEVTAKQLCHELGLDPGYLSRTLSRLEANGCLTRNPSHDDRRRRILALTAKGRRVFRRLDARQSERVREMLSPLSPSEQRRLIEAMEMIEELL